MVELIREASGIREPRNRPRPEPGILCWKCRKLTPYEEDRCRSCGEPFGGSTGGAYATSRPMERPGSRPSSLPRSTSSRASESSRSLAELLQDLSRVRDVSSKVAALRSPEDHATLFQCPSCGRFVAEHATSCACGVRFSESSGTFPCPECDALVPVLEDECPVCGVHFAEEAPEVSYSCPKCGTPVSANALRCICGVWFED